jgi:hypothetical protein
VCRQEEIDSLWAKINHIQQKLHTIPAEFLSHWDLSLYRFGLKDMIKRGGGSEMGIGKGYPPHPWRTANSLDRPASCQKAWL